MSSQRIFNFTVDKENLTTTVERSFDAPLALVWPAWTESEVLDKWWAPKPWKTETKSMEFSEGGRWLYAMVGPEGERHWSLEEYATIVPRKNFTFRSHFCDENGNVAPGTTGATWANSFVETEGATLVTNVIRWDSLETLEAHLAMGFKEGYTMGLNQLDEWLADLQMKGN